MLLCSSSRFLNVGSDTLVGFGAFNTLKTSRAI